jgi:hypothetical protein
MNGQKSGGQELASARLGSPLVKIGAFFGGCALPGDFQTDSTAAARQQSKANLAAILIDRRHLRESDKLLPPQAILFCDEEVRSPKRLRPVLR